MKLELAAAARMAEAEFTGVQGKPFPRPRGMSCQFAPVTGLAEHRVSFLGKMDADLIPPSGFKRDVDVGCLRQLAEDFVMRDCQFTLLGGWHRVPVELVVGCQKAADRTPRGLELARDECLVAPLRLALGELLPKLLGDLQVSGNDEQARHIAVEAMN